jgi:hypothetical protein
LRRLLDDAVKTAHDREPAEERRRRAAPEADAGIATHTPPGADLNSATVLSNPSLLRIQRLAGNNAVLRLMLNEAQRRGGTGKEGDRSDADHAADGVIELDEDRKNPKEQVREKQQHHQEMKEASPGAKVPRPPPTAKPTSGDGGTSTTA